LLAKPPKDKPKAMPGFSTKSNRRTPMSKIFSPKIKLVFTQTFRDWSKKRTPKIINNGKYFLINIS
jgi:hypothetical protein